MLNRRDLLISYTSNFTTHHRIFVAEWNRRNTTEITYAQGMILNLLAAEGPKQAKELIRDVMITSGGITSIANKLVDRGLIRRSRADHQDRRAVILEITDAGRDMLKILDQIRDETLDSIFNCLSDAEIAFLERIYWRLNMDGRIGTQDKVARSSV
ncbi:MarR family transcriptional regulator [Cohnella lubricantis]|uniref:MarR family transcriptional regulator n=1 Tax=Cohnella lubricantis TaxID=2163172 RepID=A0A841T9W4_9BACL|nr:MarR family transcriptional regulator [Cohnella lubricantis]MBB6676050.1 MarR family transcriptional regulator [Cohnella lubricantis]MBP2118004.1 DNA-binding MarR family transcriptional regulator [Cohnella lubricantis]